MYCSAGGDSSEDNIEQYTSVTQAGERSDVTTLVGINAGDSVFYNAAVAALVSAWQLALGGSSSLIGMVKAL
jgi:hypothetical protein